jgi:hypothetical protein
MVDDSTSIFWESVHNNFMQLGEHDDFYVLLFGAVCLAWSDFAVGLIKKQRRCNFPVQGYHWWPERDVWLWPWDKETILPMEKSKPTKTAQKVRQVKGKVKSMPIIFFDINGIVHK